MIGVASFIVVQSIADTRLAQLWFQPRLFDEADPAGGYDDHPLSKMILDFSPLDEVHTLVDRLGEAFRSVGVSEVDITYIADD